MATVFVSYSREDTLIVSAIVHELQHNNVDVWIDQTGINVGSAWDNAIAAAISEASHLLLVLSKASAKSDNVRDEFNFAKRKQKTIIVILINDVDLPFGIDRIQYIDFRQNYTKSMEKLLNVLPIGKAQQDKTAPSFTNTLENSEAFETSYRQLRDKGQILLPDDKHTPPGAVKHYPILHFESGGVILRSWEMQHANITIGRSNNCDITITSTHISRVHVCIYTQNDVYFVQDKGSTNGTWLNTKPLDHRASELSDGDVIDIARSLLIRFSFSNSALDAPTQIFLKQRN